jgi:CBS domain-containing protein
VDTEDVLENVCFAYYDELIDVRPYIWEHPFTVTIHDPLEKCLSLFVTHSLRHLCVVNPKDGSVAGIITRKDLFKWVAL